MNNLATALTVLGMALSAPTNAQPIIYDNGAIAFDYLSGTPSIDEHGNWVGKP